MTLTTKQFLSTCENNNQKQLGIFIFNNFVQSATLLNPDMKVSKEDWLEVFLNDYHVKVLDNEITLVPNNEVNAVDVYALIV